MLITVLALAALSAVMAAACGGAEDEEAKDVAPVATQAPVVQAATAAPAMAATAAPAVVAPTAAPVAQVATAAPAMAATAGAATAGAAVAAIAGAELVSEDLLQTTDVPPQVQAILDELGLTLFMPGAATTEPKFGGTLSLAAPGEAKSWDVHKYQSYRLRLPNSYSHLRLLRFGPGSGEVPQQLCPHPLGGGVVGCRRWWQEVRLQPEEGREVARKPSGR